MRYEITFESEQELLEYIDSVLRRCKMRLTADSRKRRLYIDVPSTVLRTPHEGLLFEFDQPDETRTEETTIWESK